MATLPRTGTTRAEPLSLAQWASVVAVTLLFLIYVGSYLRLPFADQDTLLYVMIGRPLVTQGILPYGVIFDHKPIGLYWIYGALSALIPLKSGSFTIFALMSTTFLAGLARGWGLRFGAVWLGLLLLGAPFGILAGNAEMAYLPLIFMSLMLMSRTGVLSLGAGGLLAGLAVQVNYLAAICLLPPMVWCLLRQTAKPARLSALWLACIVGGVIGLAVPLLPFTSAPGAAEQYFALQRTYLHAYGASAHTRMMAAAWFGFWTLCALPICLSQPAPARFAQPNHIGILRAWAVGGLLACLASGYPFSHYFLLVLTPVVLIAAENFLPLGADRSVRISRGARFAISPLLILSAFGLYHDIHHNIVLCRSLARLEVDALRHVVGNEPALGVETSHVPFALAGLRSQSPFLFPGHVRRLFGTGMVAFYVRELDRAPHFVMTAPTLCGAPSNMADICARLDRDYVPLREAPGDFGYRLYERRELLGNPHLSD